MTREQILKIVQENRKSRCENPNVKDPDEYAMLISNHELAEILAAFAVALKADRQGAFLICSAPLREPENTIISLPEIGK